MKNASSSLLQPRALGDLTLSNRVVMAPLTRTRAANPGLIPNDLMREYYAQRASAGLIISEGVYVSERARGWFGAPGIYNAEQAAAWRRITDAVHERGGKIFAQLWHQGAVSLPQLLKGSLPVAPSAVNPEQMVHLGETSIMTLTPQAMTIADIHQTIAEFRNAAQHAKDAGFDGVQLQAGYVYLIQQFLHETTNLRDDEYGGSVENRSRFLFEVLEAVLEVWPSQRVGIKAGPMMNEQGAFKAVESTIPTAEYVYKWLNEYDLSHLLVMRQMADLSNTPLAALQGDEVLQFARRHYKGTIIANVGIEPEHALRLSDTGAADLIAFGREYIANPDLVERLRVAAPLNAQRPEGYYGDSAVGYTDYPPLAKQLRQVA